MQQEPVRKDAANRAIRDILAVFEASETEEKIERMKLEREGCPHMFSCQVCFAKDGKTYYKRDYEDQFCSILAVQVLCAGSQKVRNTPKTIEKMSILENTYFLPGTIEEVLRIMQTMEFPDYEARQIVCGIEIIRKTPTCEKQGA